MFIIFLYTYLLKRWFCHADDDTYFNVQRLYETLSQYDPALPWYLGRISIAQRINLIYEKKAVEFSFATGGAGYCISIGLATKLAPFVKYSFCFLIYVFLNKDKDKLVFLLKNLVLKRASSLKKLSKKIGVPDDVLLGFIIGKQITVLINEKRYCMNFFF